MTDKKELTEIMEQTVSPKKLAEQKLEVYKDYIVDTLREIAELVEDYEFDEPQKYLSDSPAGDGYGQDNKYIDFGFGGHSIDLDEALGYCEHLSDIANGKKSFDELFCFKY